MSQPPVDSPTHAAAVNDALVEATVNTEVAEAEAVSVDAYVPSSNSARSIETHHSSFAQETLQSRFICLSPSPGRGQHSRVERRTEVGSLRQVSRDVRDLDSSWTRVTVAKSRLKLCKIISLHSTLR